MDSFFTRRARSLFRKPLLRPIVSPVRLCPLHLESRDMPTITGLVYQDYNANGNLDTAATINNDDPTAGGTIRAAIDIGLGGVTVSAFDVAGTKVATTTTKADGTYTLPTNAGNYRVEFTTLPTGLVAGPHGTANQTSVQFVADGATNIRTAAIRATDYFRTNPNLLTSKYLVGDQTGLLDSTAANNPILGASTPTQPVIVSFPYSAGTTDQNDQQGGLAPAVNDIAIQANQVGSTWGLGYDRDRNRIFAASYTKRHTGWGPGGPGAIYVFNNTTAANPSVTTATQWATIGNGTALGATFAGFRGAYTRNDDYVTDSGNTGWNAVGKTGFGGLDVSEDGTRLFVMSLADRRLYVFPINADGSAGTPQSFAVPIPSNATGGGADIRPFAVQVYRGLVYIGMVNSAETTQTRSDLRAYVYTFDPAMNTYSTRSVLNESNVIDGVSLDYDKRSSYAGADRYRPWSPTYRRVNPDGSENAPPALNPLDSSNPSKYPQPMLSGIAFDATGNMVLGIRDRGGDQTGRTIPSQTAATGGPGGLEGISSGDILKTFGNLATGWTLEAGGVGTGPVNGQGPGGGEFFAQDGYEGGGAGGSNSTNGDNDGGHRDTAVGGVVQIPGFPDVLTTTFDPLRQTQVRSGGVRWFDSTTGLLDKSHLIYDTDAGGNTFGKASGLGDLIAVSPDPVPLDVGNRVFSDPNRNGVQDPGEPVIAGATVELWSAGGDNVFGTGDDLMISTLKTAANGTYYFASGPGTNVTGEAFNVSKLTRTVAVGGVTQLARYQVRFPDPVGADPLDGQIPTVADNDATANGDARDSDATIIAGFGRVIGGATGFTLATPGASDHTLDAGFVPGLFLGDFVFIDNNNSGNFDAGDTAKDGITVNLYQAGNFAATVATAVTAGGGKYQFSGLAPGNYVVEIISPAGFRSSSGNNTEGGLVGNPNTDNTDHGLELSGSTTAGFVIRANPVTLALNGNPGQVNAAGDANLFQDFGLVQVFSLGNRVWLDNNNSGTIDAADGATPGIDGVTIRLFRPADFDAAGNLLAAAAPVNTTTTAGGGYYRFDNLLAGSYVLVADGGSAPLAGLRSSTGGAAGTLTFEPAPAGIPAVGTTDSDDNGTTAGNNVVRSGTIVLGPTSPLNETDLVAGANPQGTVDANADLTIDFGFYRPLSLGNRVFEDANNNGLDASDPGVGGVTVRVFRADGTGKPVGAALATTATTAAGYYLFTGLGADTYTVEIDAKTLPAGSVWYSSTGVNGNTTSGPFEPAPNANTNKTDADDNGTVFQNDAAAYLIRSGPVTLLSGTAPTGEPATPGIADATPDADSNLTTDFGVWRPLSLGNFVWNDANNTGAVDNGEVGIGGVPVTLYQDNGDGTFDPASDPTVGTQMTSTGATPGYYLFTNLAAGKYFVAVQPPTGFGSSTGAGNAFEPVTGLPPDNKDHGTTAGALIRSNLVTLAIGTAPTGEPATPGITDTTPDANSDLTIDFGLFQSLRIGDFVFEDTNNNGTFDAGDTTIDGVTVTLFDGAGAKVATTTTAGGGKYLFSGLTPGQYQVQIAPPAGYASSTGGNTEPGSTANTDNIDHGTQAGAVIKAAVITLGAAGDTATNPSDGGFANLTQDFGLFRPVSLGNFVWEDANNNGTFDTGEAAIPGATVVLLDSGGNTVGTQTTDANGNYLFTGLTAGTFTLRVTAPAGFVTSTGKNGSLTGPFEPGITANTENADHGTLVGATVQSTVTLLPGGNAANPSTVTNPNDANLTQDFGFYRPLSLGDLVFDDTNNDGTFGTGEKALAGATVDLLDAAGNVVNTLTTDANGNYLFVNLVPGSYTVRLTPPAGYVSSTGTNGSPTGPFEPGATGNVNNTDHGTTAGNFITSSVTLTAAGTNPDNSGLANLNQDFGLYRPLSLGNLVFADTNNDGVRNAGEAAIPGVTVQLLDAAGTVVGTATTDGSGNYLFTNLAPGTYTVRATTPTGLVSSSGTPNSLTGPFEPGVGGTQDDQDHGTTNGTFATTTVTLAAPGDPANPDNAGLANLRQDFGFTAPPVTTLSLGNLVFRDANNNGIQDAGEPGIAGVTVTLTNADGTPAGTQTTDANGNYLFTGLAAGDYTVTITPPAGSFLVSSTGKNASLTGPFEPGVSGTQDSQDHGTINGTVIVSKVTLGVFGNAANPDATGAANFRQDFGLFVPLSYGNTVFIDTNNNGKQDANEAGVAGVPVRLLDASGTVITTATTDANGKYQFSTLTPGAYQVEIVPPTGLNASTPVFDPLNTTDNLNVGSQSGATIKSAPFTLAAGAAPLISGNTNPNNFVTGDFGLQGFAQVSGFVYLDPDINGKFTNGSNGDRPIGNVTVTLTGGGITKTTTTDATGFYQFTGLLPGTYTITETQPGGIILDGLDTIGTLGGTTPSNDVHTVALAANQNGQQYNFGEIQPAAVTGYVFADLNRNCVLDAGDLRLAGVPITISGTAYAGTSLARPLAGSDGTLTVFTDATGRYEFPLLPPGSYSINRGDLTAAQQTQFADWCPQIGDPTGPAPATATPRAFTGVTLTPSNVRGPFNFGVVPLTPVATGNDPTKQNFLGSSGNGGIGGGTGVPPTTIPPPGGPTQSAAPTAPTFATTTGNPAQPAFVVAAAGAGYSPQVRVFDYATGIEKFKFFAYEETFTGGVRTATADVTGDGTADIVTATGVGGGPRIKVYNGATGAVTREFFAYEPEFRGGVFVAAGDINGDGAAEIVTGTETGGGPRVTVFDGRSGAVLLDFFAFDSNQRGGVRVAVADFNNDGRADIVTTTGAGVPTRVRVFNGANQSVLADYAPFEAAFTGGINLAAGDFNGDGTPDVVLGAEAGGGPRVQVFSGLTQTVLANFFAYESTFSGGVRVAARDVTGDGKADLALAAGPGGSARVRVIRSTDLSVIDDFFAFDQEFTGGTYVG